MTEHLVLYGTLRPGEDNHWVVRAIPGRWRRGTVRGWTYEATWGSAAGYPGFTADPAGNRVPVDVLSSDELEGHWRRLDDFEGPGYRRRRIDVDLEGDGVVTGWIYEVVPDAD